jgi:hypothetical protein
LRFAEPHDQEARIDEVVNIRKQSALEDGWVPEPEPTKRPAEILKFTEGLELIAVGIAVPEESDGRSSVQQQLERELWGCLFDRRL